MNEDIKKEPLEEQASEQTFTPETPEQAPKKAEDNKLMGILSYLGILCLIPLLTKKGNKFIFFHAKQGVILFIAEAITILIARIPVFGQIIAQIATLIWLVFAIIGIINVLGGKMKELPIIGKYAAKIKI